MADTLKAKGAGPSAADVEEIPELTDEELASARRAIPKISVTSRLDADVLEWLKAGSEKYQTRMNRILRAVMNRSRQRAGITEVVHGPIKARPSSRRQQAGKSNDAEPST
jgi:uncharacterized protein (DUF4415 family)